MKKVSFVFINIVVVFTAAIYFSSFSFAASYDADLEIKYENIPAQKNAYHALEAAHEKIYIPDDEKWEAIEDEDDWDSDYVADVLDRNKEAYNLFKQALDVEYFQVPEYTDGLAQFLPYLFDWREMALLWDVKSEYEFKQGNTDEAIDIAINNVKLGARMTEAKGSLVEQMIGLVIIDVGLERIVVITTTADISKEQAQIYVKALSKYDNLRPGMVQAYKVEYFYAIVPELERLRGARIKDLSALIKSLNEMSEMTEDEQIRQPDTSNYNSNYSIFNEEASKKVAADFYRELIKGAESDNYSELNSERYNELREFIMADSSTYPINNFAGRIILRLLLPGNETAILENFKVMSKASLVKALLALRAYKQDYGSLPYSLNALVPKYIDEIPKDYIDGEEIKYRRDDKVLYAGSGEKEVYIEIDFDHLVDFFVSGRYLI